MKVKGKRKRVIIQPLDKEGRRRYGAAALMIVKPDPDEEETPNEPIVR